LPQRTDQISDPTADKLHAVTVGRCDDPFAVLGPHLRDGKLTIRAFLPDAKRVTAVDVATGDKLAALSQTHKSGIWEAVVQDCITVPHYRLEVESPGGLTTFEDTYAFGLVLSEKDVAAIADGSYRHTYNVLGAHPRSMGDVRGVAFTVWAPNAQSVSVVGDFCHWDGRRLPMRRRHIGGLWELFVPGVPLGALYKFEIHAANGEVLPLKADPYGRRSEHPPRTASVVCGDTLDLTWTDDAWRQRRAAASAADAPISIYEVHLGSWRRVPEHNNRYLTYDELREQLVPYVGDMGFTHIELMPVNEYPFDGSWGYQPVGLYAPTSRFGSPASFARLINACHEANIGVIVDWVAGHFPTDPHGLGYFDGTHLYEHADPRRGFHHDWKTLIYNYGRNEVGKYLRDNALFWLDRYHIDALRVDAVASMLYLDYSRAPGEWVPNIHGGRENLEAVSFLQRMNEDVAAFDGGVRTIAEESTTWPGVTRAPQAGGLGFSYKWNMGWMNDTLRYMSRDPAHRRWHHGDLTFGLSYAFSEKYILPLSHDEVVHGKGSLIGRMPGDRWRKFANLRAYFGFMFCHPGKKLLFMGGEFAQEREWNHNTSLDWHLVSDHFHGGVQKLIRDLNFTYRNTPALHQREHDFAGFNWVIADDADQSVIAFIRYPYGDGAPVLAVCNFTPIPRYDYAIGVPCAGFWKERINTDAEVYGGSNVGNGGGVWTAEQECHGHHHAVRLTLPPLGTLILEHARG
jgi:1,4-alpha-glucan branching enzyme